MSEAEDRLRLLVHEDEDLAQRIKHGAHKNRRVDLPVVDCAHNIQALREMLDLLAGAAQRARAKLDQPGLDYATRFSMMDFEISGLQYKINRLVEKQPSVEQRKLNNPVIQMTRKKP